MSLTAASAYNANPIHMNIARLTIAVFLAAYAASAAETPPGTPAHTYYVDATRSDDALDGLKPESAWRSLAKVNAAPLVPGDTVLFRRGQTWRGQLRPQNGNAAGVITYAAFGEGAKPIFLGSVAADRPEDWQPAGDGVWETVTLRFEPLGAPIDLPVKGWSLHHEGGAAAALAADPTDASTLRITCRQSGTQSNHIQLSMTGLTVTAGQYYLLTFQAKSSRPFTPAGVSLMKSGAPWTAYASVEAGLPAIGADLATHTVRFLARQTATDVRLTFFLGGAIPADTTLSFHPAQLTPARPNQLIPLSVDVGNIIFDHGQSTGVKKWSATGLRRDGDYFYDPKSWQVKLRSDANPASRHQSIELALKRHIIDQGGRGYITYENLDLRYGAAHGIGGGSTQHITVRGCDISYIGGGHQHTRPDGKPVRFGNGIEFWAGAHDCLVEDCRIWEIYDAALTNQGDGTNVQENITYRRNVIWNSEYSFEFWNRGPTSRTNNIVFEHNTCVDAGRGWGYTQRPDPNGRHLMFYSNTAATTNIVIRHNIFAGAANSCLRLHGADWTKALTMDYNCWFQPAGPLILWGTEKIAPAQFAAFQQKHGHDAHSLVADPKFTDPARRDYRLAPDSPARRLPDQGVPAGALP